MVKEKLKHVVPYFISFVAMGVVTGAVATALGETVGYSHGVAALYAFFTYNKVADFVAGRVK